LSQAKLDFRIYEAADQMKRR